VLLAHGDDDRNVPFQQTTDLVEKLRTQKVAFKDLFIPDEIHDLLRWSDYKRGASDFIDWLGRRQVLAHYVNRPLLPKARAKYCPTQA
jgi:dipeptidyl aminopeptidase/acylaminoacyl peptidase